MEIGESKVCRAIDCQPYESCQVGRLARSYLCILCPLTLTSWCRLGCHLSQDGDTDPPKTSDDITDEKLSLVGRSKGVAVIEEGVESSGMKCIQNEVGELPTYVGAGLVTKRRKRPIRRTEG